MLDRAAGDGGGVLVVVDGVYSMEGDVCDLPPIVELCQRYGARLMVDEAHGVGVLGERGAGASSSSASRTRSTCGWERSRRASPPAAASSPARPRSIEYLRVASRAFIFTASAVPAAVGAALGALRIIRSEGPELMGRLLENAAYLRAGLPRARAQGRRARARCPDGTEATTPVVPVLVGEDWQAVALWKALFEAGVYTNVALHPAGPAGRRSAADVADGDSRARAPRPRPRDLRDGRAGLPGPPPRGLVSACPIANKSRVATKKLLLANDRGGVEAFSVDASSPARLASGARLGHPGAGSQRG